MGWGRTLFLGDIGNRLDIADVEVEIDRLKRSIHRKDDVDLEQEERLARLEVQVSEIKLYLKNLVQLLHQKQIVSPSEIEQMVTDVEG